MPGQRPAEQGLGRLGSWLGVLSVDLVHESEHGRTGPQEDLERDGAQGRRAASAAQAIGQNQLKKRGHAQQEQLNRGDGGALRQDRRGQPEAGVGQGASGVTHHRQGTAHRPAGHQEGDELALHTPGQLLGGGGLLPAFQDDAHDEADDAGPQAGQGAHGAGYGGRDDEDGEHGQAHASPPGRAHDAGGGRHQAGDGQGDAPDRGMDEVGGPCLPHLPDERVESLRQGDAPGGGDDARDQPAPRPQETLQQDADGQQHDGARHRH